MWVSFNLFDIDDADALKKNNDLGR